MALPLVPVARVPAAFNAAVQAAPPVQGAAEMHRYMTDTWVNPNSTFPPQLWNTYALVSKHRRFLCIAERTFKIESTFYVSLCINA